MEMSSHMSGSKADDGFAADKIIFLSKAVGEMVKKSRFNDAIEDLNSQLEYFRKNMKRFVQDDELEATVEMLERKMKMGKGVAHSLDKGAKSKEWDKKVLQKMSLKAKEG